MVLPPGPWTLPIIGSLHHVISLLPHRTMMELSRRHGPVMLLRLGEVPTVVVSSAKAAAQVMKTNDLVFASRPLSPTQDIISCGGKGIALAPYGDHWRQMRKVCILELLSSKQVNRMEGIRAEEVGNLLRTVAAAPAADPVNLSKKVSALSNNIVCRAVFGSRCTRQGEYLREHDKILALLSGFCLADLFPSSRLVRWLSNGERRMKRSHDRIHLIIADIVERRKAVRASGDVVCSTDYDLLDVLLRLQEEDSLAFPINMETISLVIFEMFGAATETTAATLEWAMSELVANHDTMAKAQLEVRELLGEDRAVITNTNLGELHYLHMVIKEVLRMHPPLPLLLPRETREDMPKGTNLFVNAYAISRDPEYWDDPEEFKPSRFENKNVDYQGTNFEFTPFGAGRRQCPGMLFGTSTVEIVLANLLYHFDWVLPNGAGAESLDMTEKSGIIVRRMSALQLMAIPHACNL
ncbi:hypothetical protein VPH35_033546 [Triticum aestivum]